MSDRSDALLQRPGLRSRAIPRALKLFWGLILIDLILLLGYLLPRSIAWMRFDRIFTDSYALVHTVSEYDAFLAYLGGLRFIVSAVYIGVGVLIFIRRFFDRTAILTSIGLLALPYVAFYSGAIYDLQPAGWLGFFLEIGEGLITFTGFATIPVLLFTFPDGRIQPSSVVKPFKWIYATVMVLSFATPLLEANIILTTVGWFLLSVSATLLLLIGVSAQIYRYYRISAPVQRQQTKWIIFSLTMFTAALIISILDLDSMFTFRFGARAAWGLIRLHAGLLVMAFLPVAIAFSILRYRLYDIDLIIRRSLQYSTLTAVLTGFYISLILGLQTLFRSLAGDPEAPLVLVVSTLAIAAAFNPVRLRIQDWIDRRFYRAKYDAARAIESFTRLSRDEVDLDRLAAQMLGVVVQTLQPEQLALWLEQPD